MIDWIVVDVEIQKSIGGPEGLGWDDTDKLGISVAVVYEFKTDRYRIYGADHVRELRERLIQADRVSGFNIWKFDYPVIWGLPGRERKQDMLGKTDDILRRIWLSNGLNPEIFTSAHRGTSLDTIALSTIGKRKSGNGAHAPLLYQAGKWEVLTDYCINDVLIERDLALFVDKYGYVIDSKGYALPLMGWGE